MEGESVLSQLTSLSTQTVSSSPILLPTASQNDLPVDSKLTHIYGFWWHFGILERMK